MAKQKNSNGDGSLRQRSDGRWELRITTGVGLNGKPVRKSFYDISKMKVKEKYREYLKQTEIPIEKIETFSDWADNWLEVYKKNKVAYKTYSNYKGYLEHHIKPAFGHLKLNQIKPVHIEQFYGMKQEFSNAFHRDIHTILRGIFDKAVDNKLCSANPMLKVKLPKKKEKEIEVFTIEELEEILKFAETHKYGHFILLPLYTGLRLGELLALHWTDVDFDEKIITIRRSIARVEKGSVEKDTKTGHIRHIGIPSELEEILKKLPRKGTYVLTNRNGNFYDDSDYRFFYSRFFKDLNKSLEEKDKKIRYLSPHKCRHTYATYTLSGGANLRAVQMLLGHTTIKTTERYTHVNLEEIKKAASMLKYKN